MVGNFLNYVLKTKISGCKRDKN